MPPKIALLSYTVLFLMDFYCFAFCFMLFLCFISGILYFNCFFKASLCVVKGALTNKIYHYYYFFGLFLFWVVRVKCPPFLIHFWNILSMRKAHLHTSKCERTLHAGATKILSICNRGLKFGTRVELQPHLELGCCWLLGRCCFSLPLAQRLDDPFSTLESEILQGGTVISVLNRCK